MKNGAILIPAMLAVCLLLLSGCTTQKQEGTPMSFYKNETGEKKAHQSYDRTMELWDTEYSEDWVSTPYGLTHIITAGPEDAKPIFLFPGLFGDASMWFANAGALAAERRVIAPDLPVYGGKSKPGEKKIQDIQDYSAWFTRLMNHYGYSSTAVGGLSYGSWLSLALAREVPSMISAVIMLDPSETFIKMRGSMAWMGFKYFAFFPNRDKYRKFFDWMGGGFSTPASDIWLEHILDVIEYGSVGMMDVPQHRIYKPEELTMITMPVLILVGGKPIIYDNPDKFAAAAAAALPEAEIMVIPGTGHSLNVEKAGEINRHILRFLDSVSG